MSNIVQARVYREKGKFEPPNSRLSKNIDYEYKSLSFNCIKCELLTTVIRNNYIIQLCLS